jgi:hypothetical protein
MSRAVQVQRQGQGSAHRRALDLRLASDLCSHKGDQIAVDMRSKEQS